MLYKELSNIFQKINSDKKDNIIGYIVFTEDSYAKHYSKNERTYAVNSNNKAFNSEMCGYSIFGSSLEGEDYCRLENLMEEEHGGKDGWIVEYCYIIGNNKEEIIDYNDALNFLKIEQ